jgi:hypothetical protein
MESSFGAVRTYRRSQLSRHLDRVQQKDQAQLRSYVFSLYRRDHARRARNVPYALAGREEMGYEAAVPNRAASHEARAASSFLYLISARG